MFRQVKKLALFMPSLRGGGVERVMLTLASGFAEKGFLVDLVLVRAEGPYLKQVPQDVTIVNLNCSGAVASLPKLIRYLSKEKPYALLAAMDHINIVALLAKMLARTETKIIVSIHSTISQATKNAQNIKALVIPIIASSLYRKADSVVAVSQGVAQDFSRMTHFPLHKISVIYNPVVSNLLFELASEQVFHPWIEDKTIPVILAVGRLTRAKDYGTLIKAFVKTRETLKAKLLILGEGEERTKLENLVASLDAEDDISLAGFSANPYPYMVNTELFVLSSQWEGLPTVLVEALALGANIVSTDCESGPREILVNGEFGRLVPPGEVEALSKTIITAINNPKKPAEGHIDLRFDRNAVADRYLRAMSL